MTDDAARTLQTAAQRPPASGRRRRRAATGAERARRDAFAREFAPEGHAIKLRIAAERASS